MCAIVDANAVSLVFGGIQDSPEVAREFRARIDSGKMTLVVGGELKRELSHHADFNEWFGEASQTNRVYMVPDSVVDGESGTLAGSCKSDDPHVVALARVSGARLFIHG